MTLISPILFSYLGIDAVLEREYLITFSRIQKKYTTKKCDNILPDGWKLQSMLTPFYASFWKALSSSR